MKKIIGLLLVILLVLSFNAQALANDNTDYESIYMAFAKDADTNFYNPWYSGTKPHGLIMVDLEGNGVPVILGIKTVASRVDENGDEIYQWDTRYNNPDYIKKRHNLTFVFGIKGGEVIEHEGNGQSYFQLPYLPFEEAPSKDVYCGFVKDSNNVVHFAAYNKNSMIKYYSVYPAYGDIIYKQIDAETFKNNYVEVDIPYAYLEVYDFVTFSRMSYEEAVEKLITEYKIALGKTVEQNPETDKKVSDWAKEEIEFAKEDGLIPDSLLGKDLTQPITRAEFAAVSVKAYEHLCGTKLESVSNNPFTDTTDPDVLKAYGANIAVGVSDTEFMPDANLSREQAATMLTRVYKKVFFDLWTVDKDSEYKLDFIMPAPFSDDDKISDWAKESVYFMAANKVISGVGNNNFAPKNTTSEEEAIGYANATREQAIIIALRMIENT